MSLLPKNLAYLRSLASKEFPELGPRLYETLSEILRQQSNIAVQTNANPNGDPEPPRAPNSMSVTAQDGIFDVKVNDENQIARGTHYFAEYSKTPDFSAPTVVPMGPSRNWRGHLGNQQLYWRAYSGFATSKGSPHVYHPTAVQGGGAASGPEPQASSGAGTASNDGTQGGAGFGPAVSNTPAGTPPIRAGAEPLSATPAGPSRIVAPVVASFPPPLQPAQPRDWKTEIAAALQSALLQSLSDGGPRDFTSLIQDAVLLSGVPLLQRDLTPLIQDALLQVLSDGPRDFTSAIQDALVQSSLEPLQRDLTPLIQDALLQALPDAGPQVKLADLEELRGLIASMGAPPALPVSWNGWSPTISASGAMTLSSVSVVTAIYFTIGNVCFFQLQASFTTGGTADFSIYYTLPFPYVGGSATVFFTTYTFETAWANGFGFANSSPSAGQGVTQKAGTALWTLGTGRNIGVSGFYRIA